jgi:hypothetical protein
MHPLLRCVLILFLLLTTAQPAAQAQAVALPADAIPSVAEYGALGDGITDDTAAIQRALDDERRDGGGNPIHGDYYGRPKALYFPPGTYLVRNTLDWVGCCVTLQGAGIGQTIIRLADNAPGFADPTNPKAVIITPREEGNKSFRQNIRDLTINTGNNNPGAIGLDYLAHNSGSVTDVLIKAGDGKGVAGLALTRAWPGPALIKRVTVEGFDDGIRVAYPEYGPTFEQITLRNQRVVGMRNDSNTLAIRELDSQNSVPALISTNRGASVILLDGDLRGGATSAAAIESEGLLYVRNLNTNGYRVALRVRGNDVPGVNQLAYVADPVTRLFDNSPERMLNLPVAETPAAPSVPLSEWAKFEPTYYGDTRDLQALFNSGKAVIYFPFGGYFAYDEAVITVPASVKRIIGFSSVVNSDPNGRNGGGIRFVVADNSTTPLIIEQFGYGVKVDHRGSRPLAIKYGNYSYTSQAGAGELFLEDVEIAPLVVQPGQRVWARQLNDEYTGTKISNNGGTLWILGLKTESTGTVIETINGGRTELYGTLIYPSRPFGPSQSEQAAFVSRDSSMSLIYSTSVYCDDCGYPVQIEETRGNDTRRLASEDFNGRMALYSGFIAPTEGPLRLYLPMLR